MITLKTRSAAETKSLGEKIGKKLQGGEVIALTGELGAGKTCLTQGLALGLGVNPQEYVTSPSFNLIKEYRGRFPLYHLDIFRLNGREELEDLGYEEYFYGEGITVIEWAEKAEGLLPVAHLCIELSVLNKNGRQIRIKPFGRHYREILKGMER